MISPEILTEDVLPALAAIADELDTIASQAALDGDGEIESRAYEAMELCLSLRDVVRQRVSS